MTNHIKKWLDEARIYNESTEVRKCIENAENGYIRIEELLKVELIVDLKLIK